MTSRPMWRCEVPDQHIDLAGALPMRIPWLALALHRPVVRAAVCAWIGCSKGAP